MYITIYKGNRMIYLFGAEKGGCGKSTLATNFAGMLLDEGKDVLLVDADKQPSSAKWVERRNENKNLSDMVCVRLMGKGIVKQVKELAKRYENIVIDAGGRDSVELRAAMAVCNRLYIPMIPSQFDAETLPDMSDLIERTEAFNPEIQATVVISKASPNPVVKESQELIEVLSDFENIGLAETVIRDRKVFRDAIKTGEIVLEYKNPINYKAINEMKLLLEELV